MIRKEPVVVEALKEPQLNDVRLLLTTYAEIRNYDSALGNFQKELSELSDYYGSPNGALFVAYANNDPAGCVAYRKIEKDTCEMKRLFVDEKFRGLGIGKQLVDSIIEKAKTVGFSTMKLDTHPWMKDAVKIYTKLGFKEIDPYHYNPTPGIRFFELNLTK